MIRATCAAVPFLFLLLSLAAPGVTAETGKITKEAPADAEAPKYSKQPPLVGAYYFNWYDIEQQWRRYPRAHDPKLGEYDLAKGDTIIDQHHAWAKEAGIDFFAMLWTGAGSQLVQWARADELDSRVADHLAVKDGVKTALVYNLRDVVSTSHHGAIDLSDKDNCQIFHEHITYAARTHFTHDNYVKINGSPVLVLHTMRDYVNYKECLRLTFEQVEEDIGTYPYIIGDAVWWSPGSDKMPWNDYKHVNVSAITAFNLVDHSQPSKMGPSFAWYGSQLYHDVIKGALPAGIQVVPMVMPGYDDTKLRGASQTEIPRAGGAEFVHQWKQMLWFVKCQPLVQGAFNRAKPLIGQFSKKRGGMTKHQTIVMVNSFNEWHEGTEIEPSTEFGTQFLGLLSALKAEIPNEQLSCGKEKDAKFKAAKYDVPRWLLKGEATPTDRVFLAALHPFLWLFVVALIWVVFGAMIVKHTGRRRKFKIDDPESQSGAAAQGKKYKNRMSLWTWLVILGLCWGVWTAVTVVMGTPKIQGFFEDRLQEYTRLHMHNLRVAREVSHSLCPGLTLTMHTAKIDEWVNKLAEAQITQTEFQNEICGDNPLHVREIVQAHLDYVGREPEEEALKLLSTQVENGEKTLPEVIESVRTSPEAGEWAQRRQQDRIKIPTEHVHAFKDFEDVMKMARGGELNENRADLVEALKLLEAQVEGQKAKGDDKGAAETIKNFFDANAGVKKHFKAARKADSLLDPPDE